MEAPTERPGSSVIRAGEPRRLGPHDYQIYLGDVDNDQQTRLTYSDAFDGYSSISPDGHWLAFTPTRDAAPGSDATAVYLEDISSLLVGPP
jgi:Tol biopolymer transport system component